MRSVIYEMLVEVAKNKKKPEELNELLIEGAFNAKQQPSSNKTNKPHTHLVANNLNMINNMMRVRILVLSIECYIMKVMMIVKELM